MMPRPKLIDDERREALERVAAERGMTYPDALAAAIDAYIAADPAEPTENIITANITGDGPFADHPFRPVPLQQNRCRQPGCDLPVQEHSTIEY